MLFFLIFNFKRKENFLFLKIIISKILQKITVIIKNMNNLSVKNFN